MKIHDRTLRKKDTGKTVDIVFQIIKFITIIKLYNNTCVLIFGHIADANLGYPYAKNSRPQVPQALIKISLK